MTFYITPVKAIDGKETVLGEYVADLRPQFGSCSSSLLPFYVFHRWPPLRQLNQRGPTLIADEARPGMAVLGGGGPVGHRIITLSST